MAFSFSQMKLVHSCPYKYKRLYIDKVKEPSGIYALFGQAVHHLYGDIVKNKWDRKEAIKKWRSYFENEVANNSEIIVINNYKFWESRGYPATQIFFNEIEKFDIQEVIAIEQRMKGTFEGKEFNFICDLIYKNSKGVVCILDYKTGKDKVVDRWQIVFYDELINQLGYNLCLWYIWSGPIWIDKDEHEDDSFKFVRQGVEIIEKGVFERAPQKDCKTCLFYKDDCSKI